MKARLRWAAIKIVAQTAAVAFWLVWADAHQAVNFGSGR